MNWNEMSIPKKLMAGFSVTILVIALLAVLNYTGVGGIVTNASEVIDGNKLKGVMVQREVDHLNWARSVNKLLTDNTIHKLSVETDDHKCGFGKFLYGEGRKHAEKLVPSLAPLFFEIEEPHRKLHESAIDIDKVFVQADAALPQFLAEKEVDHLKWMAIISDLFLYNKESLQITTDPQQCDLGKWIYGEGARKAAVGNAEISALIDTLKASHATLHQSAIHVQKSYKQIHPGLLFTLRSRLDDHRKWSNKVGGKILDGSKSLGVSTDPTECAFGKFLNSDKAKIWTKNFPELQTALEKVKTPHNNLHKSAIEINRSLSKGDIGKAKKIYKTKTLVALQHVGENFEEAIAAEQTLVDANDKVKSYYATSIQSSFKDTHGALIKVKNKAADMLGGMLEANKIYATQTEKSLGHVQEILHNLAKESEKHIMTDAAMLSAAQSTRRNSTIVSIIGIIFGIVLAFFIARGITAVLARISDQMGDASDQVASASGQVSNSSQLLAEGASEQAASIEETSASLEEMSSMTKQNADNATQADNLMKDANQVVEKANESMNELTKSMEDISKASEETSKIIKTIDEIAFQTNLLALNAAVEAARAGEAGAGFAVVADEVRNLAMRAADAAKNTSDLIEGTVKKVNEGGSLVATTNEAFSEVAESTRKVGELVGEISAASSEQAEGIEQINKAIVEMDKVTQQNASTSEEAAAASEEMNAQAQTMKFSVDELVRMVGGKENVHTQQAPSIAKRLTKHSTPVVRPTAVPARGVKPSQIIPMDDDDDFTDF